MLRRPPLRPLPPNGSPTTRTPSRRYRSQKTLLSTSSSGTARVAPVSTSRATTIGSTPSVHERCEQHTQTGACPLGSRCHNYHTHTAQERKRTFEENRRDNLRTHNDVERWLATRQPSIVSDAVLPPAPLDPEALLRSQQDNYRECSFRTQRCTRYDEETKSCPLGDRCYYYHTRKGREPKRTFDMNCRDNLCTSDDVEQWLDRRAR
ncbi:hypothetical protein, conserved [Angomonas deanei]|uniref:C3H1-type domain-containing protein n=1 Tax=Angomonas deanei TaxID=59799 RepID=A0A7G2CC21_9TRYP|nr:hypothetical protein, conserved [Angomonas deanei]